MKPLNWDYDEINFFVGFLQEAFVSTTLVNLHVLSRCLVHSNSKPVVLTALRYISCIFLFNCSFQERRRVWLQGDQRRGSPEPRWQRSIHHRVLQRLLCHDRQGGGRPDGRSHLWQATLCHQHVPLHLDQQGNQSVDQRLLQGHHGTTKVIILMSALYRNKSKGGSSLPLLEILATKWAMLLETYQSKSKEEKNVHCHQALIYRTRWLTHTRMCTKRGGPIFWIHENLVCPDCNLVKTNAFNHSNDGISCFEGKDPEDK